MTPAEVVIAPIALFAWLLQAAAPLPSGAPAPDNSRTPAIAQSLNPLPAGPGLSGQSRIPAIAQSADAPASTSIYNDKGRRLGYTVPHPDGSVDIFRSDGSRLGYSSGGRLVISPRR